MNLTSWKTTSAGVLAIVGGITRLVFAIKAGNVTEEAISTAATAILAGLGLIFARDNNVTSEDVQRAAQEKEQKRMDSKFSLFVWTLLGLLALGVLTACKTPQLEPGGAYAPTNAVGQVTSNDLGLALADASYKFAYEGTLSVFRFERENRLDIWKLAPGVKRELDKLRPKMWDIDRRWALARQAYKANPTPAGLSTLQTILAEIQRLLPAVQAQLEPVNAKLLQPATVNP